MLRCPKTKFAIDIEERTLKSVEKFDSEDFIIKIFKYGLSKH
jgi:hypothetical protein